MSSAATETTVGFRHVQVAYDGSGSAEEALALALRLRDPDGGQLVLACVVREHAWRLPGRGGSGPRGGDDASAILERARAAIPEGIPVALRTPAAASAAHGLTELAEREPVDLITIGSAKGAAGDRIGLARTAVRLLHGAPCAVAVAPPGLRETGRFHHVGVAVDASAEAQAALAAGYAIAQRCGSAVTLYSALDQLADRPDPDAHRARLAIQDRLDRAAASAPPGVNPRTVYLHGAAGREIASACDGVVDLLVTGSRGYGPVQRALLGSVSEELLARSRHPVLVMPRQPGRPELRPTTDGDR